MELSREIAGFVAAHRAGDDHALHDCVRRVAHPRFLDRVLARASAGELPDHAYRHPNGFLKIVLLAGEEFRLRLHVWRPAPGSAPTAENVHDHRWDFASAILVGGYRFQQYRPDERGEEFEGFRYHGHRGSSSYSLEPTGPARLRCGFDAELTAGSSYFLASDVLHRVLNPVDRTTVTVILQGPHKDEPVRVYATGPIESGDEVALDPLPRDQVVRELALVRDLVARPH
ncbi:hypothetical protein ABZ816_29355 [Actinosynnema sp. NPDC047251]|uniref:Cysteine dioxygenase type I n=1 Tax=Saccharothrix espanaensis (strain ATCC 51144 / DSM 44229 / JCM 9112 / NBRC 15066 / NRRL 15764) TaxID=1179773 RepID=K0JPC8_SACES|nr:hypothetical protein [Saccharothrix espanaensis]CCH28495.1 hypothetical protein BN6_11690 [Saccharothrix espanaensis DSM 44229]